MRIRLLFLILISMLMISGCSALSSNKSETINSSTPQTTITPKMNDNAIQSVTLGSENGNKKDDEVEKESSTQIIEYQLEEIKQTLLKNDVFDIRFLLNKNIFGQLKYDFNNDGKIETLGYSTVSGKNKYGYPTINKCTINYNGMSVEHEYTSYNEVAGGISSIGVMDVKNNDNSIEFYISEGELADRISYIIYRLSDKEIKEVCRFDGEIQALSGDGKIYYWGGNLYESYNDEGDFDTNLVISYFDIDKKDYVQTNQIIGKTIIADSEIRVYKEKEDVIAGAPLTDEEIAKRSEGKIVKTIMVGDKFKVFNVDDVDHVKIKTEDGKTGWIGGFHMVWD